ncbi:hypothetical protein G4B88_011766 [Cannabis sativa]|uniref:Uncharacterized protein n=1 Tax=Cannabis sativa TaxID=3483 RepID=A0A7J6GE28_CANSA|nr:hypothetical protein G4B88_011766 [Cannabis sativa]
MAHTFGFKSFMRIKVDRKKLKGRKLSAREFFIIAYKNKDKFCVDSTSENIMNIMGQAIVMLHNSQRGLKQQALHDGARCSN